MSAYSADDVPHSIFAVVYCRKDYQHAPLKGNPGSTASDTAQHVTTHVANKVTELNRLVLLKLHELNSLHVKQSKHGISSSITA